MHSSQHRSLGIGDGTLRVAQLGARMHYAIPQMLFEFEMLERFYTDLISPKAVSYILKRIPNWLKLKEVRRLESRNPRGLPSRKIESFEFFGLEYSQRRARARSASERMQVFLWAGEKFCTMVARQPFDEECRGTFTYNTAGLELMMVAKRLGMVRVMEQTIAPLVIENQILQVENSLFPGWEIFESESAVFQLLCAREKAEWELSDRIICGSAFVKNAIGSAGGPMEKCDVVPYGFGRDSVEKLPKIRERGSPIRVLFVGDVGLRKGVQYLNQLAERMKGFAEVRLVGPISVDSHIELDLRKNMEMLGSLPRKEVDAHFEWADVFVLPSVCEGSATVIYEALSWGLPVICTENCGSVVRHGQDGFIVPLRGVDEMQDSLAKLLVDEDLYCWMSKSAVQRSRQYSIPMYSQRIEELLRS
jgi:hypothetical protein